MHVIIAEGAVAGAALVSAPILLTLLQRRASSTTCAASLPALPSTNLLLVPCAVMALLPALAALTAALFCHRSSSAPVSLKQHAATVSLQGRPLRAELLAPALHVQHSQIPVNTTLPPSASGPPLVLIWAMYLFSFMVHPASEILLRNFSSVQRLLPPTARRTAWALARLFLLAVPCFYALPSSLTSHLPRQLPSLHVWCAAGLIVFWLLYLVSLVARVRLR